MTTRPNVLVVDDDPDLLRLLQIRLAAAGYAVTPADSGERALAQLAATRPRLVVTDLRMSGMDGMALFEAIRAAHPGAAGDHPDRARHDSRRRGRRQERRVRLSDQTL